MLHVISMQHLSHVKTIKPGSTYSENRILTTIMGYCRVLLKNAFHIFNLWYYKPMEMVNYRIFQFIVQGTRRIRKLCQYALSELYLVVQSVDREIMVCSPVGAFAFIWKYSYRMSAIGMGGETSRNVLCTVAKSPRNVE